MKHPCSKRPLNLGLIIILHLISLFINICICQCKFDYIKTIIYYIFLFFSTTSRLFNNIRSNFLFLFFYIYILFSTTLRLLFYAYIVIILIRGTKIWIAPKKYKIIGSTPFGLIYFNWKNHVFFKWSVTKNPLIRKWGVT